MLKGNGITLRPIIKEDLIQFNIWRNQIEIKNLALMHPFPIAADADELWYQKISTDFSNKTIFFTIVDQQNTPIGYTFLASVNWTNRTAYFGIIIGEKFQQGKGNGKEATELILSYSFNILNLNKIILEVSKDNEKAINLYKKLNFIQEGHLKNQTYINGAYSDVLIFSIFNPNKANNIN